MDKLINEKTSPWDKERAINNKNNDNNRKQNTEEAWKILENIFNEEIDLDRQKTIKNDSSENEGSKGTHEENNKNNKNNEKTENSKDNKKKQEEVKSMNGNSTKDSRDRQDRKAINKNKGQECKYFMNDLC